MGEEILRIVQGSGLGVVWSVGHVRSPPLPGTPQKSRKGRPNGRRPRLELTSSHP